MMSHIRGERETMSCDKPLVSDGDHSPGRATRTARGGFPQKKKGREKEKQTKEPGKREEITFWVLEGATVRQPNVLQAA